ncbi:hypothetical protein IU448_08515 [Nocardia flavorosea]|uniref:hypothetical protein n=1 Tax=Nocardia flavorosea TaxID=53429 RepID=UPI001893D97B|nr:hypothetical protein [Nocardia flavorosea]MBF6349062.1 hypothetical protein [Nocardia flavorosea]
MNRTPEQRTRRIAARIATIAVLALAPLALTTGNALADPVAAAPISDSDDSGGFGNDDSHGFGDDDSGFGNHSAGWNDSDFGWDDNGQYGYRDHNQHNYDGWNDQFNSGHTDREDRDSHAGYGGNRGSDYDAPADWNHENHRGGTQNQTWNVPNPYIPPAPPALLPTPPVHLPLLPHLPLPLVGLPGLPGTGSAF